MHTLEICGITSRHKSVLFIPRFLRDAKRLRSIWQSRTTAKLTTTARYGQDTSVHDTEAELAVVVVAVSDSVIMTDARYDRPPTQTDMDVIYSVSELALHRPL